MKNRYLIESKYRPLGLVLFVIGAIIGILAFHFEIQFKFLEFNNPFYSDDGWFGPEKTFNLTDEIGSVMVIIGLLVLGFTKEKVEDEWTSLVRLESLQFSMIFTSVIMLLTIAVVHGMDFIYVLAYGMFLPLLLFVTRYYIVIWRSKKELSHEE